MEWIEALKIDDEVAVAICRTGHKVCFEIQKVTGITKTLIKTSNGRYGSKFKKSSGNEPGNDWHKNHITPLTDKLREKIRLYRKRSVFKYLCEKLSTMKVSETIMNELFELAEKADKENE